MKAKTWNGLATKKVVKKEKKEESKRHEMSEPKRNGKDID